MGIRKPNAGPTSKTTLRLPDSLLERAKIRAVKEKRTLQDITTAALEAYLKMPLMREGDKS
jgi:hypothetical protein